jgi:hypothetical protein
MNLCKLLGIFKTRSDLANKFLTLLTTYTVAEPVDFCTAPASSSDYFPHLLNKKIQIFLRFYESFMFLIKRQIFIKKYF